MEILTAILFAFLLLGVILFLFYRVIKLEGYLKVLSEKQDKSQEAFGRLRGIENLITELQRNLSGNLSSLIEISRDMKVKSENIAKFFEIMQKSAGVKGGFGEYVMEDIIKKILPPGTYEFQKTRFEGRPDCVIKVGGKDVPVDSKLPLSGYHKMLKGDKNGERVFKEAVKNHLRKIKSYIRPEQGTYDFALMFVPSESVYSTILSYEDLTEEAMRLRVFPVSPSTLYVYLSALALGFKGLEVEKNARKILDNLRGLNEQISRVFLEFGKVEGHIKNAWQRLPNLKMEIERLSRMIKEFRSL